MADIGGTAANGVNSEIPPFEVEHLRRTLAEAELEDIIGELVGAFLDDAPSRMDAINTAVAAGTCDLVKASAHAYKSAAASMGAKQLAELLRQLEEAGAQGDSVRAATLLPLIRNAHDSVVTPLREEFDSR